MPTDEQLATKPFTITRRDACEKFVYSLRGRLLFGIPILACVAIFELWLSVTSFQDSLARSAASGLPLTGSIILFDRFPAAFGVIVIGLLVRRALALPAYNVERLYALFPDRLVCRQGANSFDIRWPAIRRVARSQSRLFLFGGVTMAHIIPARAFISDREATRFFDAVEQAWTERHNTATDRPIAVASDVYSVQFALDRSDYTHGFRYVARRAMSRKRLATVLPSVITIVVGIAVVAPYWMNGNMGVVVNLLLPFVAFLFFLQALRIAQPRAMMREIERNRDAYQPAVLTLTPSGLISSSPSSVSEVGWDYVDAIEADQRLLYFRMKSRFTIFVPRVAFIGQAQADAFVAAARAYKNGETPPVLVPDGVWPPPPMS